MGEARRMSQVSESTVSPISGHERRGECGPWVARARAGSVFLDAWMELVEEVGGEARGPGLVVFG